MSPQKKKRKERWASMIIITPEIKEDLLRPENLDWTVMSAVAGDDLRYGVELLIERLHAPNGDNQLTVEQIIEILAKLLKEHKESMDSVY